MPGFVLVMRRGTRYPAGMTIPRPALCLITDDAKRTPDELAAIVCDALAGGVTMVQFRERSLDPSDAARAIAPLAAACRAAGVPLMINGAVCARLTTPVQADGVHLQKGTLPMAAELCARIRPTEGCRPLLGYSAHGMDDLAGAIAAGIDLATIGPVYATPSKEGILAPTGPGILRACGEAFPGFPVLALGGVDVSRAGGCVAAGAAGVAVIRAVMAAPRPREAAHALMAAMTAAAG